MKNIELVKFHHSHAIELATTCLEYGGLPLVPEWLKDSAIQSGMDDNAISGFCDGKLVGCGGVREFWPGVGEAWAFFSPEVRLHIRSALVVGRAIIERVATNGNYRRIQATARVDFPAAASYLEHLGFEVESVLQSYSHDHKDMFMYARIF